MRLRTAFEHFCTTAEVLAWTSAAAKSYAWLRNELRKQGKALSELDLLIAAHAHSLGAVLVTADTAFLQIEGLLEVENWTKA